MEFGLRPVEGGSDFNPTLEQSELAEELGFDAVYLAEHHGYPESPYWPTPINGLAAIASRTTTIHLGTNIAQLPLYNPVRLAGEIAMLDVISDGRTRFGFGLGWRQTEFDALGVDRSERGRIMDEYLAVLSELLTSGPTSFDGKHVTVSEFVLTPETAQSPHPPFHIGGWSPQAKRRVNELGDGWVAPGGSYEKIERFIDELSPGDDTKIVVATEGTVVRDSSDDVKANVHRFITQRKKPYIREQRKHHYIDFKRTLEDRGDYYDLSNEAAIDEFAQRLAEYELRDGVQGYSDGTCFIAGTPDECIDQLAALQDDIGADEVILRPYAHGVSPDEVTQTIRLLGEEVLPSF